MDNDRASQSQRKRKNPSFFKVLSQDFSSRLKIPPDFNKVFGTEAPKKAILETYYGKSEEVEVEKHENLFYFCEGWSKFVENNKLESGDFLVFKYLSDCSKFKVKMYGKTCCEKEHYYPSETGKNEDGRDGRKRKREEEKEKDNNLKEDGTFEAAKRIAKDSDSDFGDGASEAKPINLDSCSSLTIVEEEIGKSLYASLINESAASRQTVCTESQDNVIDDDDNTLSQLITPPEANTKRKTLGNDIPVVCEDLGLAELCTPKMSSTKPMKNIKKEK
ncbi:hypothetical protein K1719_022861 [Acacia pycnantha]|nr:hypothetical protein K1719_022861 [Acacia pycnantha]